MCGKCESCKALIRLALATRDMAKTMNCGLTIFVNGYDTLIIPTLLGDVVGVHGCFAIVTSMMTDEEVIDHAIKADRRDHALDGFIDFLAKLRATAQGSGNVN